MGIIAYIRQIYMDADHYKLAKSIYAGHPQGLQRPAYDRTLEGVLASPRVLLPATRAVEIERMVKFAQELKVNAIIYGGLEAWRETDLLKKTNTTVLVSLKYPEHARDADPTLDEPLLTLELRDKAPTAAGALAKAGVKFAFYSDGQSTPRDLMRSVKKAIDNGLSPDDALRALTLTPAEIYNVSDRIGSIDKGKIANLVVADGDIFADRTKVKYVFVDGTKFEPAEEAAPTGGGRGGRAGRRSQLKKLLVFALFSATAFAAERAGANSECNHPDYHQRRDQRFDSAAERQDRTDWRQASRASGRNRDRWRGQVRHARHHRLPLAYHGRSASTKAASRCLRWSASKTFINPEDIAIYRALAGGVTTANMLHGARTPSAAKPS